MCNKSISDHFNELKEGLREYNLFTKNIIQELYKRNAELNYQVKTLQIEIQKCKEKK